MLYILFSIFIVLDQITKAIFASRDFFFGFINFHPVHNHGLPLGLDFGRNLNTSILMFVYVLVGLLVYRLPDHGWTSKWGKALLLAGAASNLADRLVFGFVRDFIDLRLGFVFNLADAWIVLGILLIFIPGIWQNVRKDMPDASAR